MKNIDNLKRDIGGFLLNPDFSFALLTTDFIAPFSAEIGLPSHSFLLAARNCRNEFLEVAPWKLNTFESQATTNLWISIMSKHLTKKELLIFKSWMTNVAPTVNIWQPLIESWLSLIKLYKAGVLDTSVAPSPIDHISELILRVNGHHNWDNLIVNTEWDSMIAQVYGTEEEADLVQHFDRIVETIEHRYIWSWAYEYFNEEIDWSLLATWCQPHLPTHIVEGSSAVDYKDILPLPFDIYNAIKEIYIKNKHFDL